MKAINKTLAILFVAVLIMISQTFIIYATNYNEQEDNQDILFTDDGYLSISNSDDLLIIANYPTAKVLFLMNDIVSDLSIFENNNIKKITFFDCTFNTSYASKLPDNIETLLIINPNVDIRPMLNNNLKELELKSVNFNDLSFLKYVNNLESFCIYNSNLESCNGLENLTKAKKIVITYTGIESINEIASLKNLDTLQLDGTYIQDLSMLANSKISDLSLNDCLEIDDFKFLEKMPELKTVSLKNCEMALTNDVVQYLNNNGIKSTFDKNYLKMQNEINKISANIFDDNMSDREKIRAAVQYVIDNIEYDYSCTDDPDKTYEYNERSLRHALDGLGCCTNYANLTQALLHKAGIKSYINQGISNSTNHIWNIVYLDGSFYYIDSTFICNECVDNIEDNPNYLATYDDFISNHSIETKPSSMLNLEKYGNINGKTASVYQAGTNENLSASNAISKSRAPYIIVLLSSIFILSILAFTVIKIKRNYKAKKIFQNESTKILIEKS
jgi:hypothetical protein